MADRKLIVEIIGDSRSLEKALDRSGRAGKKFGNDFEKAGRGSLAVSGLFSGLGRNAAVASGAFLGGAGLTAAVKTSVDAASNLNEQVNKSRAIFGNASRDVERFGKTTGSSLGIANDRALEAAGTFGNLFTTIGLGQRENAKLSVSLVRLAADLASFNNASPDEALDAIRSGLIGEAEPLRRFGVLLTEARVQQEAMNETGKTNARNLTQQEKLLARYRIILQDTIPAQGDFARTSEGMANQQRILQAELRDTQARVGRGLIPAIQQATSNVLALVSAFNDLIDVMGKIPGAGKTPGFLANAFSLRSIAKSAGLDFVLPLIDAINKAREKDEPGQRRRGTFSDTALSGVAARNKAAAAARKKQVDDTVKTFSLVAKITRAELALAKAQRTKAKSDDRAILVEEAGLLRDAIASNKKKFRDKLALNRQLTSILDQIAQIDQDAAGEAAQKRKTAAEKAAAKAKAAREKIAAIAKKEADRERAQRKKDREAVARRAKEARDAAKETTQDFRDLIQTERDRIGDLFGGPFFNPSEAQRKAALGARTPGSSVKGLIADLKAQIQQFKSFERDLKTLAKRGAPPQLLQELRQAGLDVAPQVHALATSGAGSFAQFKQLFIQRERLAVQAAKAARPIINLTVIVDKDTGHVSVKTTPHGQKRGRNPGVIINQGRVLP